MLYRNVLMGILGVPHSISNIMGDFHVRSSIQLCPFLVWFTNLRSFLTYILKPNLYGHVESIPLTFFVLFILLSFRNIYEWNLSCHFLHNDWSFFVFFRNKDGLCMKFVIWYQLHFYSDWPFLVFLCWLSFRIKDGLYITFLIWFCLS